METDVMAQLQEHVDKINPGQPAVSVECVSKVYTRSLFARDVASSKKGAHKQALDDVSFSVNEGEMIGLLGPNGAGKTTLLKIIASLLYPTSGRVSVYGQSIDSRAIRRRGMMGLVTCDERSFYWRLTGYHNLLFFAALYGVPKAVAKVRINELLDALDLAQAAHRPYHGYSSGMKQKLAIARGLLSDPHIVLYDEPTRSLDPLSAQNIRRWIADKRKRSPHQTHLIATNTLDEAENLCDRVVIINHGRIIAQGTINEIRRRWGQQDYEVHHLAYHGCRLDGGLRAQPEAGLIEVTDTPSNGDAEASLTLRTRKGSEALSRVLGVILDAGGTVVRCHTEQEPFDKVFCELLEVARAGGEHPVGLEDGGQPELETQKEGVAS